MKEHAAFKSVKPTQEKGKESVSYMEQKQKKSSFFTSLTDKGVSTWKTNHEAGFTLLETVIALAITLLCFSLLSFTIRHFQFSREQAKPGKQMEFHLFLHQFEQQIEEMELVHVAQKELKFRLWNADHTQSEDVIYERYFSVFRRKVTDKGHQPMLTEIQAMTFTLDPPFLRLDVDFTNGEQKYAQVVISEPLPDKDQLSQNQTE